MHASKWSELLERFLWSFLLACGTLALQYDPGSPGQFSKSRKHVLYCVAMTFAIAVATPGVMVLIYLHGYSGFFPMESVLVAVQLCLLYLFMIVVNVKMLLNVDILRRTFNELFALRSSILRKWNCAGPNREYTQRLIFKIVFVDVFLLAFSLVMFYVALDEGPSNGQIAMGVCFSVFRYIITAFANLYLVGLMIAIHIQGAINAKLTSFAENSDEQLESTLHHAYMLHCKNVDLEKQFMIIMNLPVLLLNCWYFFMIVLSVYYMYTSTMLELKQQNLGMEDIVQYLNSASFFLYLCLQLYCIVAVPAQFTERSKKMCLTLNTVDHQCQSQGMERLLELIMLDCMQRNYSVTNFGLYEMNRALLFGIMATVTSYVIILVQFHMQEYG
ncbi:uncharacterized protein LOC128709344 [Anopheles marshallii]|uniref:uncharacterized protein LOC128709344 n=1 Tax=Anopheles marshallii TaxID=1521116 RepID=UPI00237AFB55|nr:uncharacterized protein LOC128709344 [Anopheles marshallii]